MKGKIKRTTDSVKPQIYQNQFYEFPEDYEPWRINYGTNGLLVAIFTLVGYLYYTHEQTYLNMTGRTVRRKKVDIIY